MSEQLFVIVIVFFGLIMLMMMGLIIFLFLKLSTQKPSTPQELKEGKNPPVAPSKTQSDPTLQMCINHPDSPAQALCAISAEPICESCVREDDGVVFSLDHFRTYLESTWVEMESVRATADQTEASAHLFAFKQTRWKKNQTPTYVTTHYRIDVDSDEIESLIRLYVREEEKELLKNELNQFKNIEYKRDKK